MKHTASLQRSTPIQAKEDLKALTAVILASWFLLALGAIHLISLGRAYASAAANRSTSANQP